MAFPSRRGHRRGDSADALAGRLERIESGTAWSGFWTWRTIRRAPGRLRAGLNGHAGDETRPSDADLQLPARQAGDGDGADSVSAVRAGDYRADPRRRAPLRWRTCWPQQGHGDSGQLPIRWRGVATGEQQQRGQGGVVVVGVGLPGGRGADAAAQAEPGKGEEK
jgi:hypothetical protein